MSSPLTPEQRSQFREARARAGSFAGAARVAAFNGWTFGFFAVVSLLAGVFSLTDFLVGVGLAVVARNEFVGRDRIRALEPSGFELLWRNQLGLLALIVAYCAWSMVQAAAFPDPQMQELANLLGEDTGDLVRSLTQTVYATLIVATCVFQGLSSRYYFVRIARLRDYLRATPDWVVELLR